MFSFFDSEETKRLKSHILNLGALAKADGHLDESEMNFIIGVGRKHGLKPDDVRTLVQNATKEQLSLPDNDDERFDQLFDLVDMMLADGIVDDAEMDFCTTMAARMGFRKAIVGVLVRKISMGVKDGLSREQIKHDAQAFLHYPNHH